MAGFRIQKIELDYPISDEEIVRLTETELKHNGKIRLVLMDAISSLPGVCFPWERICDLCREYNVFSLVDGAHAVTQIPVNISQSRPDFFVSNLHKWSYVPRGCAVLYARREFQQQLHSIPIGHGYLSTTQDSVLSPLSTYSEGQWVAEHEWTGTIDWSSYLSSIAAFHFIQDCGGADRIREYCHSLAVEGGRLAADILGTKVLEMDGVEYTANMVNVKLPLQAPDEKLDKEGNLLITQREALLDALFAQDCIPLPFTMTRAGKTEWWCRLSAQIYLDLDDFRKGALALKEVCKELQAKFSKELCRETSN